MNQTKNSKGGFTLIEILIVIGIVAILATVVLIAINPARQFAQARNSQRTANVTAILNAIGQNIADNKGVFSSSCILDANVRFMKAPASGSGEVDIRTCIVPTYMAELPYDPSTGSFTSPTNYNTGYTVTMSASTKRVTVCAPEAANETTINPAPPAICLTR